MKILARTREDIPLENQGGNCFKVAFETMQKDPKKYILVHAVVTGQGPIEGVKYSHAFVIDDSRDIVIDNTLKGSEKEFPVGLYYSIGEIEISKEYTYREALKAIVKYEHWGPWDSEISRY